MQRRAVVAFAVVASIATVGAVALVAQASDRDRSPRHEGKHAAARFTGYWMGIDPLDGGDSRRGITGNKDGTFAVIGRDTVFTLCDDTDRAIVTVDRARVSGSALVSNDFVISCTNTDSTVRLRLRYVPMGRNVIRETLTTQAGEPVDEIIFHRVSR